ncbi:MAG: TfoX/Sxy family DNA transformation protein [Gammaproteobacteria bacterium]|nr:TfoX/Sxy family DNA transformation protein [Gammaproteobacteria bacterium]MDP2142464.1 TfoX/Sxy family DNA transformation protein [Gammaproteobacteria bacterium]MDP2346477.1 TfoX/Sxy family DNA transformation protein [Gammaproteobacteria bacterium]
MTKGTAKRIPLLPGFGPKSTLALQKVGVTTLEQLHTIDPYVLYARLKANVPGTSLNFLYAIFAALDGCDWRDVKRARRTEILLRLEDLERGDMVG